MPTPATLWQVICVWLSTEQDVAANMRMPLAYVAETGSVPDGPKLVPVTTMDCPPAVASGEGAETSVTRGGR